MVDVMNVMDVIVVDVGRDSPTIQLLWGFVFLLVVVILASPEEMVGEFKAAAAAASASALALSFASCSNFSFSFGTSSTTPSARLLVFSSNSEDDTYSEE